MIKKKLAYITSRFPYPLDQGDKLRAYYQIKSLSKYYDIYLFSISIEKISMQDKEELIPYCKEIYIHYSSRLEQGIGLFNALLGRFPFQVGYYYSAEFDDFVEKKMSEYSVDILWSQLVRTASYAKNFKGLRLIDYMDAFSVSMDKRAELSSGIMKYFYKIERNKVARYEDMCKDMYDGLFFITSVDAKSIDLNTYPNCLVYPNGVDQARFFNIEEEEPVYDIGFIGNLGYPPNQEAVETIIHKIMPLYKLKFGKELSLLVAGARPPEKWNRYNKENIHIKGWYPDINKAYNEIKIFIAYYYSSTGQQNKILEALSAEVPVLCNPELNQSILATNEKEIVLADTLDMMVNKLKLLLDNPSKRISIGKAGKQLCKERFHWDSIAHQIYLDIENMYELKQKNLA